MDQVNPNQDIVDNFKLLVVLLRKGNIPQATKLFPLLIPGLKSISVTQSEENIKRLALAIRGILMSFQKKDYVLIADLLEYEVLPVISK
jgi:hypothetical protein